MGYKPTIISARGTVPASEEDFWRLILEIDAKGPWTVGDIVGATRTNGGTISGYCKRLKLGGYIEAVGERPHPRGGKLASAITYRVLRKVELTPRLDRNGKPVPEPQIETIWRTMKMYRTFSARDIARAVAESTDRETPLQTVRSYFLELHRVGLIAIAGGKKGKAGGGTSEAVYRIVRNIGARAPRILAARVVYDPNARVAVGSAEVRP